MIELFLTFLKIGFLAFGGGYGALGLIQDEVVVVHSWIDHDAFLDLLSISQMTPGPIAINTATFIGYRLYGLPGSFVATAGVVLPSLFWVFLITGALGIVAKKSDISRVLEALRFAVIALIISVTFRIGMSSITDLYSLSLLVFVIWLKVRYRLSVIWIVLISGLIGVGLEFLN
ncbi:MULTISPECIES: chromate transporter [Kosmotoga]|uniref:Chromate transporter n=1 Tax=Kosmotoga olearia (strain ATCC BAA-1733 / DSM 21960 / TBF 19.5.1) TaxID=521045 RepID=C5CE49_KOSOT|nr:MULTISPECIES: chromate transporter [Kosmotoga]ACR79157.1 Chromate transporter [Kosmotoga olearia TBF 19.5.1]OAA23671.1 chromate transporter [Kosmotoga sp. DU53]